MIGGQAFPIKHRPTAERSPSSKLIEQPGAPNFTGWRQMKHACGENPSRVFQGTRLDTIWAFRAVYNEARLLKERQDKACTAVEAGQWIKESYYVEAARYLNGRVAKHGEFPMAGGGYADVGRRCDIG